MNPLMRRLFLLLSALALSQLLDARDSGQDSDDRFVRLMSSQSVRVMEKGGRSYRQAEGPARFLHNNTWLICDTALWDVDAQIIHAMGHVIMEQETTELTSDSLNYFVERNTAEFRGSLVQLKDKDGNTLRTRNLDYNTKDSVAVFRGGAAMRDKDGQLIESRRGMYDSKIKRFDFNDDVNMYTDSVFVKSSVLNYDSNTSVATFPSHLDAWKDDSMLSGNSGWWDRAKELFFFRDRVHVMSPDKEGWCDSLYFDRARSDVKMMGNAQVTDTSRAVTSLAGFIFYRDSLSIVEMSDDPVILLETIEKDKDGVESKDTVYFRADSLYYRTVKRNEIDQSEIETSSSRLKEIADDPVENLRAKAAEEAAMKKQEAIDNDPNAPPELKSDYIEKQKAAEAEEAARKKEEVPVETSSLDKYLVSTEPADSVAAADTLQPVAEEVAIDSTKMGFLVAKGSVKVFRNTLQASCDSLLYSDLDSLARLFINPVVWNDVKHQYNADSMYLAIHSGSVDKAYLFSNAFIHIEEEKDRYYDQIKSTEMTAFFGKEGELSRFDAMGGANAIFYMKEKEKYSTANVKEAKILSAEFENGDISRISYFENPKSAAFPIAQMSREEMYLKGYRWTPDIRPESPFDLTDREPRMSERKSYERVPRARFVQTERFFKGYMAKIYREIERSDSLRRVGRTVTDTLAVPTDSLSAEGLDSLAMGVLDPMAVGIRSDSSAVADPLDVLSETVELQDIDDEIILLATPSVDALLAEGAARKAYADSIAAIKTPAQLKKEAKAAERAARAAAVAAAIKARNDAREARWAELDMRDSLKVAARYAKKHEKADRKQRAKIEALREQKAKEDALLEKYTQQYIKKFTRHGLPVDAETRIVGDMAVEGTSAKVRTRDSGLPEPPPTVPGGSSGD